MAAGPRLTQKWATVACHLAPNSYRGSRSAGANGRRAVVVRGTNGMAPLPEKNRAPSIDGALQVTRSSVKLYAIKTLIDRAECVANDWSEDHQGGDNNNSYENEYKSIFN